MHARIFVHFLVLVIGLAFVPSSFAEWLQVKPDRSAIVKAAPTGDAEESPDRLAAGTRVEKVGETQRYYSIRLASGAIGWSYKGNFSTVEGPATPSAPSNLPVTKESLLARTDLLHILVLDVEVGDSTLVICPEENGARDVILIDTGENDSDRIAAELVKSGFILSSRPITRFIATHYDYDHIGAVGRVLPWTQTVYDHGNNNIKDYYLKAVTEPGIDRRKMTLGYEETFSGGVRLECVAVNQATDFNPTTTPSVGDDNPNSIATIFTFGAFDYFTAGDLTFTAERSLATGIRNVDVYHANHHGSRTTSSDLAFVTKLDPEVTVASNGTRHGHPSASVAKRLVENVGSVFFQTNANDDTRANQPAAKFIGDASVHDDDDLENDEGALGTIRIVVDPKAGFYYVIMPNLPLAEGTFRIE